MHITALVKDLDHVCCRYRVLPFRAYLERAGHTLDVRAWPGFWPSRFLLLHHLRRTDLLLVQRQGMSVPIAVERRLRAGQPLRQMPFFPNYVLRGLTDEAAVDAWLANGGMNQKKPPAPPEPRPPRRPDAEARQRQANRNLDRLTR